MTAFTEPNVEAAALDWLAAAPDVFGAERDNHGQVPLQLQPRGQSLLSGTCCCPSWCRGV